MYTYRIEQAVRAASILHKDQLRKGSAPLPYVTHLYAVAMIVSDYTDDEDTIITALLHDTLEDTDYTEEELQEDFGGHVLELVRAVSEPQDTSEKQYSWTDRKKAYAKQLKKAPMESLVVAAADKIHNMRCIVEEYYDDHARYLNDFGGKLDERALMYQDISNVLNSRLKNAILSEFNHVYTEYKNFILDVKKTKESRF
ncbi:bifunctional (p)ppGpp synthetase/guanosine-3',5'-bis(diphosphate) 3'-pyrophosphohydrolase [Candidatus Nomurabacteria bacterium]|nr:bifunctional (p)ppGpp synthetase/guanosine-3',5'-bis(diphosphate) 3'-pyrophosphohydrolase [Candidatus Nomurabacteria bacterium]